MNPRNISAKCAGYRVVPCGTVWYIQHSMSNGTVKYDAFSRHCSREGEC
jgi:hypothetical protein